MEDYEITSAETLARALIEKADWNSVRIRVPYFLLWSEEDMRNEEFARTMRGSPSGRLADEDWIGIVKPQGERYVPSLTGREVPGAAKGIVGIMWDGMVDQLPHAYPILLQRRERLQQQVEVLEEAGRRVNEDLKHTLRAVRIVRELGGRYDGGEPVCDVVRLNGTSEAKWVVDTDQRGGQRLQLKLERGGTRVSPSHIDWGPDWHRVATDDGTPVKPGHVKWKRKDNEFVLSFPVDVTFKEAYEALEAIAGRLELKYDRSQAGLSAIAFTTSIIDNVTALYELAGYVPRWDELGHDAGPIVEPGAPKGVAHERTMKVGRALLKSHEDGAPLSFKDNTRFLEWAADTVRVSVTTIRKALEETGRIGKGGTRGATAKGLNERIENIMEYARAHAEEKSSSPDGSED